MESQSQVAAPQPPCRCPDGPRNCRQPFCPYVHETMELLGRRWTGAIVCALLAGRTRFSDLRDTVPDLSDRMLSERLKELETEGIVSRKVTPDVPVRIEYTLTPKGLALAPIIRSILAWCGDWLPHAEGE